ncbi:MAG: hypothetical protein JWO87_2732, partial [Phycisphaerales bacterium]|nr:hypothetical protein [Phycisphaerales bacterium]
MCTAARPSFSSGTGGNKGLKT